MNKRQAITVILILLAVFETIFVGCGGSGGDENTINVGGYSYSTQAPQTYVTPSVIANNRGGFRLSSVYSNMIVEAEPGTIKEGAAISLTERTPQPNESRIFGASCSRIYKLKASIDSSYLVKNVDCFAKPVKITLSADFPSNAREFYLARKSPSATDWKYTKLENSHRNYNVITSARAVLGENVGYRFELDAFDLGEEFTVFSYNMDGTPVASSTGGINGVKTMDFTTDPQYLMLKLTRNDEVVHSLNLVVNTCVEAQSSPTLFTSSVMQTTVTFLTDNPSPIAGLYVVGGVTALANETVSPDTSGAGDKYLHTIYFSNYPYPEIKGKVATYSFTIRVKDVPLSQFPDTITVKSMLTDATPITYQSQATINRVNILSYLVPTSPVDSGIVPLTTPLEMKYLAHDIASVTVQYTYPGLGDIYTMTGNFTEDPSTHKLVFRPSSPWPADKVITATATVMCCEDHGTKLSAQFRFKTEQISTGTVIIDPGTGIPYDQLSISMVAPIPNYDVGVTTPLVFAFSGSVNWKDDDITKFHVSSGTVNFPIEYGDYSGNRVTLHLEDPLWYLSSYTIVFDGLIDEATKRYVLPASFTISTGDGVHPQASIVASDSSIVDGRIVTQPVFIIDFGTEICKSKYINENKIDYAFNCIKVHKDNSAVPISELVKHWIEPYRLMELTFKHPIKASATYVITMLDSVTDYQNLPIIPFDPYEFTTLPDVASELIEPNPTTDVPVDTRIAIKFGTPVEWIATYSKMINLFIGKEEIATKNYEWDQYTNTIYFEPREPLYNNTTYTVLIAPGMYNEPTKQNIASAAFYFSTCDTAHYKAKVKISPASLEPDGRTLIKTTICVDFMSRISNYNLARSSVRIKKGDVFIAYTPMASWNAGYSRLDLTYDLEPNTEYTVMMENAVYDYLGKKIDPFDELTFTTTSDITTQITTPATSTDVATNSPIIFTFSDDIAWIDSVVNRQFIILYRGMTNISSSIASITYATDTQTLTVYPKYLYYTASYTIKLLDGMENIYTGQKVGSATLYFETADGPHENATISIASDSVLNGDATLIPVFTVDFKKEVLNLSAAESAIKIYRGDELLGGYRRKWYDNNSKMDIIFTATLVPEADHRIEMTKPAKDYEGLDIEPFEDYNFRTCPNIVPSLIKPNPPTLADVDTQIVLGFSNDISWDENDDRRKIRFRIGVTDIPVKKYIHTYKQLEIVPEKELQHNETYTITIMDDLVNDATRQEVATLSFDFTTNDGTHATAEITVDPASESDGLISLNPTFYVNFKKNVHNAHLNLAKEAIRVYEGGTELEMQIYKFWDDEYKVLKIMFANALEPNKTYTIKMSDGVKDFEGIYIDSFEDFEFSTQTSIGISMLEPSALTGVATNTRIVLGFTDHIDWGAGYKSKFTFKRGSDVITIKDFVYDNASDTLTLTFEEPFFYMATYTLTIKEGLKNNTTQQITKTTVFEFCTTDGIHSNAQLIIRDCDKVDDMLVVSPTFIVDFGKEVYSKSSAESGIKLFKASNNQEYTTLTKKWEVDKRRMTITPDTMLESSTEYRISMDSWIRDLEGTEIIPFESYVFTTTPNGNGSKTNPYHVYTASQLDNIRKDMKVYYIQMRDIDIATPTYKSDNNTSDRGWTPIGNTDHQFIGGFNGNGKVISGLSIYRPTSDSVGLFGHVASGSIQNVILEDGFVIGEDAVGGIGGYVYNCEMKNCVNRSVNIKGINYCGGIAGSIYSTKLTTSQNQATVTGTGTHIGGIVGWNNMYSVISGCGNSGDVIGEYQYVGGIAGYNNASANNCCSIGHVVGFEHVGGIMGYNNKPADVNKCFAAGLIDSTNLAGNYIGGIVGHNDDQSTIKNCFICDSTYINGARPDDNKQVCWNEEGTITNNYCFGSSAELKSGIADPSKWSDNSAWSSKYWKITSDSDVPVLVDIVF